MTYVESLRADTDLNDTGEIGEVMADRVLWRQRINITDFVLFHTLKLTKNHCQTF